MSNIHRDGAVCDPEGTFERICAALQCDNPRCPCHREGQNRLLHCPGHDDQHPSLSITLKDGRILLHCLATCTQLHVIQALESKGLWYLRQEPGPNGHRASVTTYELRAPEGRLVALLKRVDYGGKNKKFTWLSPDGTPGLPTGTKVEDLPLFGSDKLQDAPKAMAVIVEGPTAASRLAERLDSSRYVALGTVTGAASCPSPKVLECLRGRAVILWPDLDPPGLEHMRRVASAAWTAGVTDISIVSGMDAGDLTLPAEKIIQKLARPLDPNELGQWANDFRFISSTIDKHGGRIEFLRPRDIISCEDDTEYIWDPWIAKGTVTLIHGREKLAGKSTFVWLLVRALVLGEGGFLGRPVKSTGVVFLTEESLPTVRDKLVRFGLERADNLSVMMRRATKPRLEDLMQEAVREARAIGAEVMVADTFGYFSGLRGEQENQAGAVAEAVEPLLAAAAQGLAVVVVHHSTKGQDEARGSTALTASVDAVLHLTACPEAPNRRKLEAIGRLGEAEELVFELVGDAYRILGSPREVSAEGRKQAVLAVLSEAALTAEEVATAAGLSAQQAARALAALVADGAVERSGTGKKGDPFRFRSKFVSSTELPYRRNENETNLQAKFDSSTERMYGGRNEFSETRESSDSSRPEPAPSQTNPRYRHPRCGFVLRPAGLDDWLMCPHCVVYVRTDDPALKHWLADS